MRNLLAVALGLISGALFFLMIEPAILGQHPTPTFDREASIVFLFRLFPLFIIPSVCLTVAALDPRSRKEAFQRGMFFANSLLLPWPVFDQWRTTPSQYGLAFFSVEILTQVAVLVGFLVIIAGLAAAIAAFAFPVVRRVIFFRKTSY